MDAQRVLDILMSTSFEKFEIRLQAYICGDDRAPSKEDLLKDIEELWGLNRLKALEANPAQID